MHREPDRDFFLLAAMEWAALRARCQTDTRGYAVAAAVSREAAVCHLLFRAGRPAAVLARLRVLCRDLLGVRLPDGGESVPDAARTLGAAAELFHRLRLAADAVARTGAA